MKDPCSSHEDLMRWAGRGAGAPLGEALERHVDSCSDCAREHAAIADVRRRLQALPVRRIAPERLDAIRFELLAAARTRPSDRPSDRPSPVSRRSDHPGAAQRSGRPWQRHALLSAAATVLALAVALLLFRGRQEGEGSTPSAATVELADGANGLRAHGGPDEVYALLLGSARFHVRPLRAGERFRVVAGGDTVEVRGTRFVVTVEEGSMAAVDVHEGAVVLSLADGATRSLAAGQSWRRAPVARSSVTGIPAEPAAEPAVKTTAEPSAARAPASGPVAPLSVAGVPSRHDARRPAVALGASTTRDGSSSASSAAADGRPAFDAEFQRALDLLRKGQASEAAAAFDAIYSKPTVDPGRRADALYWAAHAHAQAGHDASAEERARKVVEAGSWHADDAALLLGESSMRRGDKAAARPWLERAARSPRAAIRSRAERVLQTGFGAPSPPAQ